MAVNQYISVKVCGNPDSNSGFVPILLFNSPSFAVEDQFYVGFDNCSYFYTIKTTKTQTIYKLVKNNVRSFGAARAGSLVIAFSVPKNYVIEGGYTPYDVLEKLKNEFLKKCMTCKDPVRETYEFNSGRIDQHVLDEVACEFTISPQPSPDRVMNPNAPKGYVVKSDAEIEKMFHDLNYPEFDNYSEVVVAESVNQTSYTPINNIQIPRPKSYSVFVNGAFKMSCADLAQMITVSSNSSPEYYENKSVHFTIQNLKDGDIIPGIELQEVNERIIISTQGWATPKRRTIGLKIVPAEFESYFFTNKHLLKLRWPFGTIQLDQNLSFTLEGEQIGEIKKGTIRLELEQNEKFTLSKSAIYGDELRVTIEEIKRQNSTNFQGAGHHRYPPQGNGTALQPTNISPVVDVCIYMDNFLDLSEGEKTIKMSLITPSGEKNIKSCTQIVSFKRFKGNVYEGHFYLPKNYAYSYIEFPTRNHTIQSELIDVTKDTLTLTNNNFKIAKEKRTKWNKSLMIIAVCSLISLLMGIAIGLGIHDPLRSLFSSDKVSTEGPISDDDNIEANDISYDDARAFLEKVGRRLMSKDVTFREILDYKEYFNEHSTTLLQYDKEYSDGKVCNQIRDYSEISQHIQNGNLESIKNDLERYNNGDLHIFPIHAELVKLICRNTSSQNLFMNNFSKITGFDNIEENLKNKDDYEDISNSTPQQSVTSSEGTTKRSSSTKKTTNTPTKTTTEKNYWDCEVCKNAGKSGYRYDNHDQYKNHLKSHQER